MIEESNPQGGFSSIPAWWIFRLRGIEITDWDIGLDQPMFGDASLISFGALSRSILENEQIIERQGGSVESLRRNLGMWGRSHRSDFSAFIAVRRPTLIGPAGPVIHSNTPAVAERERGFQEKAEQRASEIAAALGLVFMRDEDLVYTSCGLEKLVPNPPSHNDGIVDFGTGLLSFSMGGSSYPHLHPGRTQTTREELQARIQESKQRYQ